MNAPGFRTPQSQVFSGYEWIVSTPQVIQWSPDQNREPFSEDLQWSGLPYLSSGDLPNPGIKPGSSALQADSLSSESPRPLSSKDFHSIVFHCNTNQYRGWAHMNRPTLDFLKLVQVSWQQLQGIRAAFWGFSKPDFYVLPTPVQGTPTRPSCNNNLWNKNTEDEIKKAGPHHFTVNVHYKGTQYVWGILLFGYLIFTETLYCHLHFYRWELKHREVKQFDKCHTASKWLKWTS